MGDQYRPRHQFHANDDFYVGADGQIQPRLEPPQATAQANHSSGFNSSSDWNQTHGPLTYEPGATFEDPHSFSSLNSHNQPTDRTLPPLQPSDRTLPPLQPNDRTLPPLQPNDRTLPPPRSFSSLDRGDYGDYSSDDPDMSVFPQNNTFYRRSLASLSTPAAATPGPPPGPMPAAPSLTTAPGPNAAGAPAPAPGPSQAASGKAPAKPKKSKGKGKAVDPEPEPSSSSAVAVTKGKGKAPGGRVSGSTNYHPQETQKLLDLMYILRPIGNQGYIEVAKRFNKWVTTSGIGSIRTDTSLRDKYERLLRQAHEKPPTGSTERPFFLLFSFTPTQFLKLRCI